jgi:hypothetical protein
MTDHLIATGTVFLILFAAVGAYDGLYLHLWKYRSAPRALPVRVCCAA